MKEPGKIAQSDFEEIFAHKLGYLREEVTTGPSFGVDVSVVNLPGNLAMAMTSDPLSLIPSLGLEESAWLSVHLMANDMATTGFAPMYGQFVLNLPPWLTEADLKTYWNHVHQFCCDINVAITGGHTGSIEGQNSTIAGGGTMITIAEKDTILVSKNARAGDLVLVTKQCAMSSTAILAMSFPKTIQSRLGRQVFQDASEMFYKTTSLQDGLVAAGTGVVTAMHDVTEGGVLGAVYEMAVASNNGVLIDDASIPVGDTQQKVCDLFALDPKYCLGSGAMVITVQRGFENKVITALAEKGIESNVIGEIVDYSQGINMLDRHGEKQPILYQQKDPYWSAFYTAIKNNWK